MIVGEKPVKGSVHAYPVVGMRPEYTKKACEEQPGTGDGPYKMRANTWVRLYETGLPVTIYNDADSIYSIFWGRSQANALREIRHNGMELEVVFSHPLGPVHGGIRMLH